MALTPPELASSPVRFQREDGTSVFRPRHSAKYSSTAIIEAEARLLDRSEATTAPTVRRSTLARVLRHSNGRLSTQQRTALESITTSGRQVDLLVGPAGAGKTTTMRALRSAWIVEHGQGSVIGLAPSAAAAQALADDLGIACDNTAKWLHEYDHGRTELRAGQLVIIDEATLAGTTTLDRISGIAEAAGAKVLLVGDPYQLQSVDAGGAFALLVDRRTDAPELTDIHRFLNEWEKHASLALRRGEVEVISTYVRQDRIREGLTDEMLDRAYEAWRADCSAGKASILVTESSHAVRALNERARAERLLLDGAVDGREVQLADGNRASVGDVITRRNDRTLRTSRGGWVKNGDRWRVIDIRRDGSCWSTGSTRDRRQDGAAGRVRRRARRPRLRRHRPPGPGHHRRHLPRRRHPVDDQGEPLRLDEPRPRVEHRLRRPRPARRQPLDSRARRRHGPHRALRRAPAQRRKPVRAPDDGGRVRIHGGIDRLAAELETIAADAQRDRFVELLRRSGLTPEQHETVARSSALGPLTAALRRAEAYHHDLENWCPASWRSTRSTTPTTSRQSSGTASSRPPRPRPAAALPPRLIAGLIPTPLGEMSTEHRHAIDERAELIEARARSLVAAAVDEGAAWCRRLGTPPTEPRAKELWTHTAMTVAAYRDRHKVDGDLPLGEGGDDSRYSGQTVNEHIAPCARQPACRARPNQRTAARRPRCLPSPLR